MKPSKIFAAGLILILFVVHQDFWNWGVTERIFGGLPRGFVYQVGLSVCAAFVWLIITMMAWPKDEWGQTTNDVKSRIEVDQTVSTSKNQGGQA